MIAKWNRWTRDILFWLIVICIGETSIKGVSFTIHPQGKVTGWILIGGAAFVGLWNIYTFIKNKTNGNKPVIVGKS